MDISAKWTEIYQTSTRICDSIHSTAHEYVGISNRSSGTLAFRGASLSHAMGIRFHSFMHIHGLVLQYTSGAIPFKCMLLLAPQTQVKRWAIHCDISAPLIIIPDSFHSKDATLVRIFYFLL